MLKLDDMLFHFLPNIFVCLARGLVVNKFFYILTLLIGISSLDAELPLFWWQPANGTTNFGDELSHVIVERILHRRVMEAREPAPKLLAVGSILHFADNGDCVWGSGINGKHLKKSDYRFEQLDVRSVRGPLTRAFLLSLGVKTPEKYGDPALLMSLLFPEFKPVGVRDYIIIPHISEENLFCNVENVVSPSLPWHEVVQSIVESKFVISGSLHGIIVAESYGIPARLLYNNSSEPLFKYIDYYLGTHRHNVSYACNVKEALLMGGAELPQIDVESILHSFPYDHYRTDEQTNTSP